MTLCHRLRLLFCYLIVSQTSVGSQWSQHRVSQISVRSQRAIRLRHGHPSLVCYVMFSACCQSSKQRVSHTSACSLSSHHTASQTSICGLLTHLATDSCLKFVTSDVSVVRMWTTLYYAHVCSSIIWLQHVFMCSLPLSVCLPQTTSQWQSRHYLPWMPGLTPVTCVPLLVHIVSFWLSKRDALNMLRLYCCQCVPVTNQGFKRGSYKCECLDGYYFPDTEATVKAFSGYEIDLYFSNVSADGSVASKK